MFDPTCLACAAGVGFVFLIMAGGSRRPIPPELKLPELSKENRTLVDGAVAHWRHWKMNSDDFDSRRTAITEMSTAMRQAGFEPVRLYASTLEYGLEIYERVHELND